MAESDFSATTRLALAERQSVKVLVSCPINSVTGYGTDGIELLQAMMRWGLDVYVHPSGVHPPLPADVAALVTKQIPPHVDLLISHRCPQELAASTESAGLFATSTIALAWTMWEWDSLDNVDEINQSNCEHAPRVADTLSRQLSNFDAVMVYDEVSKQALNPFHDRVDILQGGCNPVPPVRRDWNETPFRFLMAGALSSRKNPFSAIQAYKDLRDAGELKNSQLVMKTTYPGLHPAMEKWCPGLRVIGEVWSVDAMHALYKSSHVLLAPSWGEGKNRPALEFAMSGGAVAATNIGGHAQWMNSDYAWPLKFSLEETYPGCRAAIVDPDSLKQTMLDLYSDRSETARRAATAARVLPGIVSWDRVLERLMEYVRGVGGRRGQEVATLMQAARRPSEPLDSGLAALQARAGLDAFA